MHWLWFLLFWLWPLGFFGSGWILLTLVSHALPYLTVESVTQMTPPPGEKGGTSQCHRREFYFDGSGNSYWHAHRNSSGNPI